MSHFLAKRLDYSKEKHENEGADIRIVIMFISIKGTVLVSFARKACFATLTEKWPEICQTYIFILTWGVILMPQVSHHYTIKKSVKYGKKYIISHVITNYGNIPNVTKK